MKKLVFFLMVSGIAISAMAQTPATAPAKTDSVWKPAHFAQDALLSHWVVDINLLGGGVSQTYSTYNSLSNYNNAIGSVSNTGKLTFNNGLAYGFDAQIAYFFGKKNNFGIGTGFMFLGEQGTAQLDQFHVEYQNTDNNGNVFRQLITSEGPIKETLHITNMNIPVLFKFKHRLSHKWGITGDAGALINLQLKSSYNSNAKFDYEGIYQTSGSGDNITTVYDNSPTPNANDVLYTKAQYNRVNPGLDASSYFNNTLRGAGLNVGLGVRPNNSTGDATYMTGSIGFLIQPGVNYYFSDMVALNLGLYYLYQPFSNTTTDNTAVLTNKVGDYSSVLFGAKNGSNQSYGLNVGVRIYLGKGKDSDGDGIPDRIDRCPDVQGPARLNGCPDSDGDGIADIDDSCPHQAGIAKFNGCPDSDGDGIPDKDDACPYAPGPAKYHGCPDRDGDGILDKDDKCPDQPGLAKFQGCPDTDGDGVPDNEDACPTVPGPVENHGCPLPPPAPAVTDDLSKISQPILFEVNKTVIHKSSYPTLIEAARKLDDDKDSYILVDGYTDITGSPSHNKVLSVHRAAAVKAKLVEMGIDPKRIKIAGHAAADPAAPNDNAEDRMKNRRAVMHLNVGE